MMVRLSHHASLRLVMIGGVLWAVTTGLGCADRAASPQAGAPSATIVAVEGASTTYHTRDWNGKRVTVRVPSQSVTDIKDKDADGTVRATVTSVDTASQHVRVRTSEGQTIVLAMARDALAGLKAGDRIVFTMPGVPRT
jgi:hypothetical protein